MTDIDDNLRHWRKLSPTDPKQTKPFQRPGGFKGTAIKPIWNIMRRNNVIGTYTHVSSPSTNRYALSRA